MYGIYKHPIFPQKFADYLGDTLFKGLTYHYRWDVTSEGTFTFLNPEDAAKARNRRDSLFPADYKAAPGTNPLEVNIGRIDFAAVLSRASLALLSSYAEELFYAPSFFLTMGSSHDFRFVYIKETSKDKIRKAFFDNLGISLQFPFNLSALNEYTMISILVQSNVKIDIYKLCNYAVKMANSRASEELVALLKRQYEACLDTLTHILPLGVSIKYEFNTHCSVSCKDRRTLDLMYAELHDVYGYQRKNNNILDKRELPEPHKEDMYQGTIDLLEFHRTYSAYQVRARPVVLKALAQEPRKLLPPLDNLVCSFADLPAAPVATESKAVAPALSLLMNTIFKRGFREFKPGAVEHATVTGPAGP